MNQFTDKDKIQLLQQTIDKLEDKVADKLLARQITKEDIPLQ